MSDPNAFPPLKGHRPYYFDDPTIDQLHSALLAVTQELSVARERIDTLERVLEQSGHLQRAAIESFVPDASADAERTVQRASLIARVLKPFVDYREHLFNRKRDTA